MVWGSWRWTGLALAVGAVAVPSASTQGAEPSGTAVAVLQSAEAAGSVSGRRVLAVAAPVFMGDSILTGSVGQVQLRFRDQTRLVVGPNSKLLIDSFVFKSDTTAKDVSINAVRGAFRFITGGSPKQAYAIHTPTATIGVRGTKFDFSVGGGGKTSFVLYDGSAKLCDLAHHCVVLSGACSVAVLAPHQPAERVRSMQDRAAVLGADFPFLRRQNGLGKEFRVDTSSCQVQRADIGPGDGSSAIESVGFESGAFGGLGSGGGSGTRGNSVSGGGGVAANGSGGDSGGGNGHCVGNCGNGNGNGGGNGTGNEGNGHGKGKGGGKGNGGKP